MFLLNCSFLTVFVLVWVHVSSEVILKKKYEFKHSFKRPYMLLADNTVPFWTIHNDAIATDDMVRLAPSIRSKFGSAWNKFPITFDSWEVELTIRISGRGRLGADGFAFWYRDKPGYAEVDHFAPQELVFGATDKWNGLGVMLDSYDNDGKQQNVPHIYVIGNDGTFSYNHAQDGGNDILGQCVKDFRNRQYPVRLRIQYDNTQTLTIWVNNGISDPTTAGPSFGFEQCFRMDKVGLPRNGYFGVSAATGGLADDHDILGFITHRYVYEDPENPQAADQDKTQQQRDLDENLVREREEAERQYAEHQKRIEELKEKYRREHPERQPQKVDEAFDDNDADLFPQMDEMLEDATARDVRNIFHGQNKLFQEVISLDSKVSHISQRQEVLIQQVSGRSNTGFGEQQGAGSYEQQTLLQTVSRDVQTVQGDVRQARLQSTESSNLLHQVRQNLVSIEQRVAEIQQQTKSGGTAPNGAKPMGYQGGGSGGGGGSAQQGMDIHEIKDRLTEVAANIESTLQLVRQSSRLANDQPRVSQDHFDTLNRKLDAQSQLIQSGQRAAPTCPPPVPPPGAVTTMALGVMMVVQTVVIAGFVFWQHRRANQKQKFF